jgi:hypothetical protein
MGCEGEGNGYGGKEKEGKGERLRMDLRGEKWMWREDGLKAWGRHDVNFHEEIREGEDTGQVFPVSDDSIQGTELRFEGIQPELEHKDLVNHKLQSLIKVSVA